MLQALLWERIMPSSGSLSYCITRFPWKLLTVLCFKSASYICHCLVSSLGSSRLSLTQEKIAEKWMDFHLQVLCHFSLQLVTSRINQLKNHPTLKALLKQKTSQSASAWTQICPLKLEPLILGEGDIYMYACIKHYFLN